LFRLADGFTLKGRFNWIAAMGALGVCALLSGCATCEDERILRLDPGFATEGIEVQRGSNPSQLSMLLDSKVEVWIAPCSDPGLYKGLCMNIFAPEGTKFQLLSDTFSVVDTHDGSIWRVNVADSIFYDLDCEQRATASSRSCSSAEASPTASPRSETVLRNYQNASGEWMKISRFEMPVSAEISGAALTLKATYDPWKALATSLNPRINSYRRYVVNAMPIDVLEPMSPPLGTTKVLRFPALLVDNRRFSLPDLKLSYGAYRACSSLWM
jgi:hypothetical protein